MTNDRTDCTATLAEAKPAGEVSEAARELADMMHRVALSGDDNRYSALRNLAQAALDAEREKGRREEQERHQHWRCQDCDYIGAGLLATVLCPECSGLMLDEAP